MKKIIFIVLGILLLCENIYCQDLFEKLKNLNNDLKQAIDSKRKMQLSCDESIKNLQNEKRQQELVYDKKMAELLYKKAQAIFDAYGDTFLLNVTNFLLEAVELDPYNQKYKDYLLELYYKYWKNREDNLIVNEDIKKEMELTETAVRRLLEQ